MSKKLILLSLFLSLFSFSCGKSPIDDGYYHNIKDFVHLEEGVNANINARVISIGKSSIIIYDGTASLLVYAGYNHNFKVGEKYNFKGHTVIYGGYQQFSYNDIEVSPYEGVIKEFDYTPTEISSLDLYDGEVGDVITIKGEICYISNSSGNNYYNGDLLEIDREYELSFSDALDEYVSILDGTNKNNKVAVDITGIFYGKTISYSFGGQDRFNLMPISPLVDTSLSVKYLSISDKMANYYNIDNIFAKDNQLNVAALYENGSSLNVIENKYSYEIYYNDEKINPNEPFNNIGEYVLKVNYFNTSKEMKLNVSNNDVTTIIKTADELANINNWAVNSSSSSNSGIMNEAIAIKAYGSSAGNYSSSNSCWSVVQKGKKDEPIGQLEIKTRHDKYEIIGLEIDYGNTDSDIHDNREGYLVYENKSILSNEYLKINNLHNVFLLVEALNPNTTNAVCRIFSITVSYVSND